MFAFKTLVCLLACVPWLVASLGLTDSIQDGDPGQSGYLSNHNMQPATVNSAAFGILWKQKFLPQELWYARSITYTPNGGSQLLFTASAQNWIRTLDALNGTIIKSRQVQAPFLQSDIGCTDIPNYIGIIGSPIMDPSTETVYFFSKGYKGGASSGGVLAGQYMFYAVNINTLADVPGFPVVIDGNYADNDPTRYFLGGTVLQRPALTMVGNTIIGGFGGHCDLFNYTGMVVGVSKTPGVGVTGMYVMEASPGAPTPQPLDYTNQQGGKAGIWQSGMGLATDGSRIFFATGNGQGHQNNEIPASGRSQLTTLDEAVVNLGVDANGKFHLSDYFEPYEYIGMDGGDRDLGSGGVALLDPGTFHGTNGVQKIAVSVGKNGKAYILNADNLGGFKQGSGATDNIIQTIIANGPIFGGSGSYPLEGGFIYFTPIGGPMVSYKLGLDGNGAPLFTLVGTAPENSAGRVGVGIPTITTYKGQPGTGIVWVTDVDGGLRAYNAVPDSSGVLTKINLPPSGGMNKFLRPVFGDGRLYVSDAQSNIICFGSPVALPLKCSSPVDFGDTAIGTTTTVIVNCTTLIAIASIQGATVGDATFQVDNSTLPTGALAQGAAFSFPVTWNLTQSSINNAQNASFGTVKPGIKTTPLTIYTVNTTPKFSNQLPITLQGNTVSKNAFLQVSPQEVDFGGIVVGGVGASSGLSSAMIVQNSGTKLLTFSGFAWTLDPSVEAGGTVSFTNTSATTFNGAPATDVGHSGIFTSSSFPTVGSTLSPGQSVTIPLNFFSSTVGSYQSFLTFWSDGGVQNILLSGSASTSPIANISISTNEGGWDPNPVMDFGNVLAGNKSTKSIRICNSGGSVLSVTKSKPPIDNELFAEHPGVDLHEGQHIPVNECALGPVDINAIPIGPNRPAHTVSDVWILNTDDINFGVHDVAISATITTRQIGPLFPNNQSAVYMYLGCYYDGKGRNLQTRIYSNAVTNENGLCQTTCHNAGYIFAGTQYHQECWCGNPSATGPLAINFQADVLNNCNWACPADTSQSCGGPGSFESIYYDVSRYTPNASDGSVGNGTVSSSVTSSATTTATSTTGIFTNGTISTTTVIPTTTTVPTTTSTTTTTPIASATGIIPGNVNFTYIGCQAEPTTGRALPKLVLASDLMTEDLCLQSCYMYKYAGIEYARECWCGDVLAVGSAPALAKDCNMLCKGNTSEYCGGSSRLQLYAAIPAGASTTTTTTTPTTTVASSSVAPSTTSVIPTTTSSVTPTTTSVAPTTTSIAPTTTTFTTDTGSVVPTTTTSVTPTTISSSTTDTGSGSATTTTSVSSTTTTTTTTSVGTTITTVTTATSTSALPSSTATTATATATPTMGFYAAGCFADLVTGHSMKQIAANNSMTPQFCMSVAKAALALPTPTTYRYIGVEYGRECYAATAAISPEPSSLIGNKACTMTCMGNATQTCGGSKQYNIYFSLTDSTGSAITTPFTSPPGVFTTGTVK